jgi:hypothetical protein
MAAAKKGSSVPLVPPFISNGYRWLIGPGRPFALAMLIFGFFFGAWYFAWGSVGPWLLAQRDYQLTVEDVELTPPPKWIRNTKVREEGFLYLNVDPGKRLSLLDDDLVERIHKAYSLHPWVARVVSVQKFHPARVVVELEYRQPVCMVQVQDDPASEWTPIDGEGVVLPSDDFTALEKKQYPRVVGFETRPAATPGVRWPDPRIHGAAEIAAAVQPAWERFGLEQIVAGASGYGLITRQGTRINWGRAGTDLKGEPSAAEKAAKLDEYFKEHNSLNGPGGRPQNLDLTRRGSIEVE